MKSSSFPSVRVDPDLRQAAEDLLMEGESLSSFVEQSIRQQVQHRHMQQEFIARGMKSRQEAKRKNDYISSEEVLNGLDEMLSMASKKSGNKSGA